MRGSFKMRMEDLPVVWFHADGRPNNRERVSNVILYGTYRGASSKNLSLIFGHTKASSEFSFAIRRSIWFRHRGSAYFDGEVELLCAPNGTESQGADEDCSSSPATNCTENLEVCHDARAEQFEGIRGCMQVNRV